MTEQSSGKIVIKNVELLDTPVGELYDIGIQDCRIAFIDRESPSGFAADKMADGRGMLATPGMVNTHGHVSMTLFRSYIDDLELNEFLHHIWALEDKLTQEDIYWGAMLGITEMLKSGTTCFADMYYKEEGVAKASARLGIRANLSQGLIAFRPDADSELDEGVELFRKWHGFDNDRIRVTLGPHAPYTCTDEYLKKVITAAETNGIELQMHLCETKNEVETSLRDFGMTPIERMEKLGLLKCGVVAAHAVFLTENDMCLMAKNNVRVSSNPQSELKLASGIPNVPGLMKHGILLGIGTDGASSNNNLDMLEEVRLSAILYKGNTYDPQVISAAEAWKLGTSNGAKVLGFENVGELKVGQYADIVLWDMNKPHWYPRNNKLSGLVYAANSGDVDTVFVNGRMVVTDGKLTVFDEDKIYEKADELAESLLKRQHALST